MTLFATRAGWHLTSERVAKSPDGLDLPSLLARIELKMADAEARYFGVKFDDRSLVPGDNPRIGATRFVNWLARTSRR